MAKYVIKSITTFYNQYYVEVGDPDWAGDSIVMQELEPFSSTHLNESILEYQEVEDWPKQDRADVNAAGYSCVYEEDGSFGGWLQLTLWDYAK